MSRPAFLLEADGEQRRVVLRLREIGSCSRQSSSARTRGGKRPGELRAVDQPFGWG
jgi:hypothetical protein